MNSQTLLGSKEAASVTSQMALEAFGLLQKLTDQTGTLQEVTRDVAFMKILMVNVCFYGNPEPGHPWVLIDTGLPDAAESIIAAARQRFGSKRLPEAIILTHGHFDHVGAVVELIKKWAVPVYAHKNEIPFLTGKSNYFTPDPTVDGGLMAKISPLYPSQAIQLGDNVHPLPDDGTVPGMAGNGWLLQGIPQDIFPYFGKPMVC
jgi:glyoxylase-like metal-dependent hydrolase (beta-lactamase superfamily II)